MRSIEDDIMARKFVNGFFEQLEDMFIESNEEELRGYYFINKKDYHKLKRNVLSS